MKYITLSSMLEQFSDARTTALGTDFFIMDLAFPTNRELRLAYPCCFEGMVCLYCISGEFKLLIGLDEYEVRPDCFAVSLPGDIIRFTRSGSLPGMVRLMAISSALLAQMEFDMTKADVIYKCRMVRADKMSTVLINDYRQLFRAIVSFDHSQSRRSLGFLLRSMHVELARIWDRLSMPHNGGKRDANNLVDRFVSLVAVNHAYHRDLGFYASSLNLTPKYLSAAIKEATGRTGQEWINSYVILEAKHYLMHTKLPVKVIAYELRFVNQMDFYRYFQRHTGMTPSEYRSSNLEQQAPSPAGRRKRSTR